MIPSISTETVEPIDTVCSLVFFDLLDQQSAERTAAALRVVADPARLRILNLIANHPAGEVCQAQFTAPLGLSQPTVSHHLKVLHDAGLLRRQQRGSWAYYSLERDKIESLRSALVSRVVSLRPKWYTFASGEDWPPEGGTGIDR